MQAILQLVEQTWRDEGLSYSESQNKYGAHWQRFYDGYRTVQQAAQEAGLSSEVCDSEVCDSELGEGVMAEEATVY